jgi:hypothetical protein
MRYLITAGFVGAAFIAYYYGFEMSSGVLFLAGVACELISLKRLRNRSIN